MYVVTITNDDFETPIHNEREYLPSGKITKGINTIDSFSFSILPNNIGFSIVNEFTTLIKVYNSNRARYDFIGRVLHTETTMEESGEIAKSVTCESVLGYLCDSQQAYVATKNWTVSGLLTYLIDYHNSQVEDYKKFKIGTVTATDSNDNLYLGISRKNTWESIKENLLNKIGGELQCRVEDDGIYIDYLDKIGETKTTPIELSVNMRKITREQDPTAYVTRLIPLGCKISEGGKETEKRLGIASVNNGVEYIEDVAAVELYGIHVGYKEWDDVTDANNLLRKARAWLEENNRVQIKYSISALDLSLIGLAVDDFDVGNYHPVKNGLIGIDDTARIIKKTVDICNDVESSVEIGDNFKTLSDIQRDLAAQLKAAEQNVSNLQSANNNFAHQLLEINKTITETETRLEESFSSRITQLADSISLEINGSLGSKASIILSAGTNQHSYELDLEQVRKAFANDPTAISISAGVITFNSNTIVINSTNFQVDSKGNITATNADIAGEIKATSGRIGEEGKGWTIDNNSLYYGDEFSTATAFICTGSNTSQTIGGHTGSGWVLKAGSKFGVTKDGDLYCTSAHLSGTLTTSSNSRKVIIDSGGIDFYFGSTICGSIISRYHANSSGYGIALTLEENGQYIMFQRYDGINLAVDYVLNNGWTSNYEERHIFYSSVAFTDSVRFQGRIELSGQMRVTRLNGIYGYDSTDDHHWMIGVSTFTHSSTGTVDAVCVGLKTFPTTIRGSTIYYQYTSTVSSSDRNEKNSIEALPDAYETVFDSLEPVRFKYNEGTSGRYHVGYIAQDVEAALTAAGLSTMDFAGYVDIERSGTLGLMYDEFIALLHMKIKRLEQRIAALETN